MQSLYYGLRNIPISMLIKELNYRLANIDLILEKGELESLSSGIEANLINKLAEQYGYLEE